MAASGWVDARTPDIFAERKIYSVGQMRTQPSDPRVLQDFKPLNIIDDMVALFDRDQIKFERRDARLDAVGADPALIQAVVALQRHAMFVLSADSLLMINQINDTRPDFAARGANLHL